LLMGRELRAALRRFEIADFGGASKPSPQAS
jgi:hypothetical protein